MGEGTWSVLAFDQFNGTAPLWQPVALSSLCYFCCLLLVFRRFSSEFLYRFVRCGRACFDAFSHFGHFVLRFSVFVVELFGSGLP